MLHQRINARYEINDSEEMLAQMAGELASSGIDTYSEYGVGAIALVEFNSSPNKFVADGHEHLEVYGGININISGMEYKVHAEQLAMFNLVMDIETESIFKSCDLKKIVVATTENDHSLTCGHCLQVIRGLSEHYGWTPSEVDYMSVAAPNGSGELDNQLPIEWEIEHHTLDELMPSTYVENRE